MTETPTDSPTVEWTYREIPCRLYRVTLPNVVRWIGYAKFGDEWIEAIDREDEDEESARDSVESFVDLKILGLQSDDGGDDDTNDPFVPVPMGEPTRDPPDNPWRPIWVSNSPIDIDDSGSGVDPNFRL